jgi:AcrR family transcriptional regulator
MPNYAKSSNDGMDGRQRRSLRTKESVAEAMLNLLERGVLRPTVKEISSEAGVSERAVFRHFQDTNALYAAVAELQLGRILPKVPALPDPVAPLDERVVGIVARWTAANELITPVRRAAATLAPFSDEISQRHEWMREVRDGEIRRTFGTELKRFERSRRADAVLIIDWALAWSTWEHHRRYRGASVKRARGIVSSTIREQFS